MIDVSWFISISFSTSSRGFVLESICETLLQKIRYGNTKDLTTISHVYTLKDFFWATLFALVYTNEALILTSQNFK